MKTGLFSGEGNDSGGTVDNTTTPNLPYKSDTDTFENSNLSQDADGKIRATTQIIAEGGVDTPPGTITLGDGLDMKASGPQQVNESRVTGIRYQLPYQTVDKTGTGNTFETDADAELTNQARQPVFDTQLVSPAMATLTPTDNEIVNAIYIYTDGNIKNFRYQTISTTTSKAVDTYPNKFDWGKDVGVDIIGAGIHKIDLYYEGDSTPSRFLDGQELEITMKWDNDGGTVLGNSSDVPFYEVDCQVFEFIDLINKNSSVTDLSDVINAGSGSIITTIERNKLGSLTGGRYLGVFADLTALQTAYPAGVVGDNATVTATNGNIFYWNVSVWSDSGTGYIGNMLSANNLSDVADVPTARNNLNVDESGTDNSTNVTLAIDDTTQESLDLTGQALSANQATTTTDGVMSSEDKTKLDDAVTATQVNNTTGYANYLDSSTSISSRTYAIDIEQLLINDKTFPDGARYPDGVTSYWDSTANKFTPDQDDGNYSFTIDFVADPDARDKRVIVKFISYGAGSGGSDVILHSRLVRLQKDDNELTQISMSFTIGITQAVVTNGVSVTLQFEETACEIYDITCGLAKVGADIIV